MKKRKKMTALQIINLLERKGFEAYFVGGCVRDELINKHYGTTFVINDEDIATNAKPHEIIQIFADAGCTVVTADAEKGVIIVDGQEVTTFRGKEESRGGTIPFVNSLIEDAKRRDIRYNAIYKTSDGQIVDPLNGEQDIINKQSNFVGDAAQRIKEDKSRMLRMIEQSLRFDFLMSDDSWNAICQNIDLLAEVAPALQQKIFNKSIKFQTAADFIATVDQAGGLKYFLPEVSSAHLPDILRVVKGIQKVSDSKILLLAAVFYRSDRSKVVDAIRHLEYPKEIAQKVALLVQKFVTFASLENEAEIERNLRQLSTQFGDRGELLDFIELMFEFIGVAIGKLHVLGKQKVLSVLSKSVLYRSELEINGKDLMEMGFSGKLVGAILQTLVTHNLKGKEECLKFVQSEFKTLI